jgi:hypothetical protein
MAGPMVLGEDPDTGRGLDLTVYDDQGARHTFIVAATGGGKTTLYSNMAEDATGRADVLVWAIDLRKGTIPFFWGDALDARAGIGPDGTPEYGKALAIVAWGAEIIRLRSATSGGKNHVPAPGDPAVLILLDEGDSLLGAGSPVAHKAREYVGEIWKGGRSAGVGLAFAGQRGVIQYTGTKDIHANSGNKIILRVQRPSEMNKLIEGWELEGMPDMSTYGAGKPGVALIVGPDGTWQAGRVRDLHDLDAVAEIARRRGRLLRGAEDADEGGVHDADGNPGESGGVVGEVSATSARCREEGSELVTQRGWAAADGRDVRQRACAGQEWRCWISLPGTGPAAGPGSAR